MKTLIIFFFSATCVMAQTAQTQVVVFRPSNQSVQSVQEILTRYKFTNLPSNSYLQFPITVSGNVNQQDVVTYFRNYMPVTDYNYLVQNIRTQSNSVYDVTIEVYRQETNQVTYQSFEVDVFRALVYQE